MLQRQLLAVSGLARSGKSQLLQHLSTNHGFEIIGASKIIRGELERTTEPEMITREMLRAEGNRLRAIHGPDFIIQHALSLPGRRIAIDGIRNLRAARTFYAAGGVIIGLVARPDVRFDREVGVQDGKAPSLSVDDMVRSEQPELNSTDSHGLQLLPVLWTINPERIIDTSDLSIADVCAAADTILSSLNVMPYSPRQRAV